MELPFDPEIPLLGIYSKNPETPIQKNLCTLMFIGYIGYIFIIAKICIQPKCPSVDDYTRKLVHLHNGIGIPTFCDSMDGTGDYYAK